MRVLIQRVTEASVHINNEEKGSIAHGLLIFVGIAATDEKEDLIWTANKIIGMRVFPDHGNKMNNNVLDAAGNLLVVSQFTLHASTKKGNRPSYMAAAKPEVAKPLYEQFVNLLRKQVQVETGTFGADMQVSLVNDGPVTIWLDSQQKE